MMGQRAKDVFEQLPHQYDAFSFADRCDNFFHGFTAQLRLQNIMEILFAQQIKPIAADASEQHVQKSRREGAVRRISKRSSQCHARHSGTSGPALRKALRIPGEKAHGAHCAQFKEESFHSPIGNLSFSSGGCLSRIGNRMWHRGPMINGGRSVPRKIS